jgi:chromosome segregation ATPase
MSVVTSIWLASLVGAVLFYLAGALTGRRKAAGAIDRMQSELALARTNLARDDGDAHALEAAWSAEVERLRASVTEAHNEAGRLRAAADTARADARHNDEARLRVEAEMASLRVGAEAARAGARQAEDMRRKMESDASGLRSAADSARADARRAEDMRRQLESDATALRGAVDAARAEARRAEDHRQKADAELGALRSATESARADARHAETARHKLEAELAAVRSEVERAQAAVRAAEASHRDVEDSRRNTDDDLRVALVRVAEAEARAERAEMARGEVARSAAASVEAAEAARRELAAELGELRARAPVADSATDNDTALRLDLAVLSELARARTDESGRLRDENAQLRQRVAELITVEGRLVAALAENDDLRAEGFRAGVTRPGRSEPHIAVSAGSLQELVERVGGLKTVRAAVITDELGLVVAATGEYSDVLAAFGRHLADEGQRVRELLPLHDIRQLSVHDDHDVTMTVRPLSVGDYNLALVTLGIGVESEGDMRELLAPTL